MKNCTQPVRLFLWALLCFSILHPIYAQELAYSDALQHDDQGKQMLLRTALKELEEQYGISFTYRSDLIDTKRIESVSEDGQQNLEQKLDILLKPHELQYKLVKKGFYLIYPSKDLLKQEVEILKRGPDNKSAITLPVVPDRLSSKIGTSSLTVTYAEEKSISGKVTDGESGEPLPGVNVLAKGTTTGTVTDIAGNYRLTVSDEVKVLVFSSIGYLSKEISIANKNTIDIGLFPDIQSLSEVVVVGYGTQQKKDITGSVGSVRTDEIRDFTVGRVDQALVGKVAGVQVKQTTGEPGAAPQILVRGYNSIDKDASPLFVVDGHPIDNINSLNPNDIERIDILKDASATAIYGSRGTNGVVLITTKQGSSGQGTLDFNFYLGTQSASNVIDMMNAQEIAQFQYDSFVNRNLDEGNDISGDPTTWRRAVPQVVMGVLNGDITTDTDWLDEIFNSSAIIQSYQLSSSGRTENLNYYVSGEYFDQDGIIDNSNFKRYAKILFI